MFAAPDYKALYFELFRASEQAARLLHEAQQRAEEQVMAEDEPPLRLEEPLRPHAREGKASPTRRGVERMRDGEVARRNTLPKP